MKKVALEPEKNNKKRKTVIGNTIDFSLLVAIIMLICIGLVMLFSSSYYFAEYRDVAAGNPLFYFTSQLKHIGIGFAIMLILIFFDYHNFIELNKKHFSWLGKLRKIPIYWVLIVISLILFALCFTSLGKTTNGANRWFVIFGINVQPSEILKLTLIVFISCYTGKYLIRKTFPWKGLNRYSHGEYWKYIIKTFWIYFIVLIPFVILLYKQPNYSVIILISVITAVMLFFSDCNKLRLLLTIIAVVAALIIFVYSEEYRKERIISMVNDPLQRDEQTRQSMFSLGTGGLFGKGLGNSMSKNLWLPLAESDYIFAVIAEELGFVGAAFVIILYAFIIWRGIRIAKNAPDTTGSLMAIGITTITAAQVILNIGVVTAIIPTTGVTLPFVSYGGSSIIICMAMMGIMLNISKQCKVKAENKNISLVKDYSSEPKDEAENYKNQDHSNDWDM